MKGFSRRLLPLVLAAVLLSGCRTTGPSPAEPPPAADQTGTHPTPAAGDAMTDTDPQPPEADAPDPVQADPAANPPAPGGTAGEPGQQEPPAQQPPPPQPPTPQPPAPQPPESGPLVALKPWLKGLDSPVGLVYPNDGSGRLFVVEQSGRIRVVQNGQLLPEPFLDLTDRVVSGGERGLLAVAFHPNYRENGLFFVNYTGAEGHTRVARYRVSAADPNRADPGSGEVILLVEQPYANHNGGDTKFGPDGYLYIALGDGGAGGDPHNHGQNLESLLGKLLRIDVDGSTPYGIPPDNPFVSRPGRDEIWAYGLRNPWRFSFDRQTGDLYIADVGQNRLEEINFQPASSGGGQNYGWNIYEARERFKQGEAANPVFPVAQYTHDEGGCSITGGYVYRGQEIPWLQGAYLYGDYCTGKIWALSRQDGEWKSRLLLETPHRISSFAEDQAGELYVVHHGGEVYKLTPPGE